jgi:hypothetical protein
MSRLILPTAKTLIKSFATNAAPSTHKFVLPALPYAYSALEPAISGQATRRRQPSFVRGLPRRCDALVGCMLTVVTPRVIVFLSRSGQIMEVHHTKHHQVSDTGVHTRRSTNAAG